MNTQAVEGAQSFMCATVDIPYEYGDGYCEEHRTTFDRFCPAAVSIVERLTPHIETELRAEIAAEIEAEADRLESTMHLHDQDQDSARNVIIGVLHAANVVEGTS